MAVSGARRAAWQALADIDGGLSARGALHRAVAAVRSLDGRDRALATELVYGTTRWRARLDAIIDYAARGGKHKPRGAVRRVLRLAAYELFHLEGIPARATCHQAVALTRRVEPRAAGFVNVLCRRMQRLDGAALDAVWPDEAKAPAAHWALRYSHPEWLVARWIEQRGIERTRADLAANNEPPPVTVRVHRRRIDRDALREAWRRRGIEAELTRWSPDGLTVHAAGAVEGWPGFAEGLFTVQGEASQLVARIVDPRPGERVLDMCSAPGGKTTHMAELMDDAGDIVALDVDEERLVRVAQAARRLGLRSIQTRVLDAVLVPEALAEPFHRVLLDAPCTGLGVLRRHPEARWQKRPEDIEQLAALQARLLDAAAEAVQPGGCLVYSVCSTEPEETVRHVAPFLQRRPDFRLDAVAPFLPAPVTGAGRSADKTLTLLPSLHGTDGFFIARFRRTPSVG